MNVLTVDYRGFRKSGGTRFDKLTPQEQNKIITEAWPGDIDIAFQYLLSQPGVKRHMIGTAEPAAESTTPSNWHGAIPR